jgi:hypothetical protein
MNTHSATTFDFAYCRTICRYQINYQEKCEIQTEHDYVHGIPLKLFTMLWIEGYLNYIIQTLFPEVTNSRGQFDYKEANKREKNFSNAEPNQNNGVEEKFNFIVRECRISGIHWSNELKELKDFRNKVCHAKTTESKGDSPVDLCSNDEMMDKLSDFSHIKKLFEHSEKFLMSMYQAVREAHADHKIVEEQLSKSSESFFVRITINELKSPEHPALSQDRCSA